MKKTIGLISFSLVFNTSFSQTGETLQSVIDRGSMSNKAIILTTNTANYTYIGGSEVGFARIGGYSTAGTPQNFVINQEGGNVGIGIVAPIHKLDVNGSIRSTFNLTKLVSGSANYQLSNEAGLLRWGVGGAGSEGGSNVGYNYTIYRYNDAGTLQSANDFVIQRNTGYVGLGTASPSYKLHIAAGNNDGILVGHYNDRLGWDGTGEQPGYHIRFAGYRDVTSNFTGARISALRTNVCCNGLSTGMELAFYTSPSASQTGDANLVERMRLKSNGYVGIGTNNPSGILHLNSSYPTVFLTTNDPTLTSSGAAIRGNDGAWLFGYGGSKGNEDISIGTQDGSGARTLSLAAGGKLRMKILANGYIGIGTSLPQSELAVKGTVTAQKIKVTMDGWADYVFDSSYQLASLSQVESFIKENKHLPEVPSAAEVKKDGLDLGDSQVVLLKKIEELTLYIIQQNKQIDQQNRDIKEMKSQLEEVKTVQRNRAQR